MRIAHTNKQSGQTLIETLVAIFVLVTGLISAISLSIYSFNSTDNASRAVVATSLAREGVEVIRNLRDSNWLAPSDLLVDCSDLGSGQKCRPGWRGTGSQLLSAGTMTIDLNTINGVWTINKNPSTWVLYYDSNSKEYNNTGVGTASIYSRKIQIDENSSAPYTVNNPLLTVTSTVWWSGRKCPVTTDPSTLLGSCKVVLQTYLTNWRNY